MTNKHSRLKALEKLAAFQKVKAKTLAAKLESDRLQATVAALTNEELNARYQLVQDELAAQPNPELEGLTTEQIISKYAQICRGDS